ncbi:serine/threonine protein kinase [uncultured Psychrobacter sp.]|uniref:protein kinase domain-containing protein n=1 Tax=uncultured Psychrobacter sp. TaxID=259303 RepID=UPI003457E08D
MTQQENSKPRWVKDQLSQRHMLTKELGKGGQGIVYRTSDPELLVKIPLKNHKEITDKVEVKQFQDQLERLYLLPLNNEMHITRPLYLLEEQAGYVMQMMQDMQPIGEWLPQVLNKQLAKKFTRPIWLSDDVPLEAAYSLAMYAKSGGTKRRLELLAQATIELVRLHSVGVIFMDVSPDNIYCSMAPEHSEVWMIDADNLRFETVNAKSGVITPQYGAPEVVKGIDGARVISDAYSLALLAFKILTMSGAFDGQRFIDAQDKDEDWAADYSENEDASLEVQAEQGELPFIFDAEDNSNIQTHGLPHELVLTPLLLEFFQSMFGEGRIEPWRRPSLHSLPRLLASAADSSIQCVCGMSFYYQYSTPEQSCPYCKYQHQELLVANSYFHTPEGLGERAWTWATPFVSGQDLRIPRRLSGCFDIDKHNAPMLEINQVEQDWFIYVSAEDIRVDVTDNNGRFRPLISQWLLERQQLEEGVQLYLHAPYSMIIEIKVHKNNAI